MIANILCSPPKAPVQRSATYMNISGLAGVKAYLNQAKTIVGNKRLKRENKKLNMKINTFMEIHSPKTGLLQESSSQDLNRRFERNSNRSELHSQTGLSRVDLHNTDSNHSENKLLHSKTRKVVRTKNVYDSIDEEEEWDMEEEEQNSLYIDIDSVFYKIWQDFVFYLIIYTILITPLRIAFFDTINIAAMEYLDIIVDFSYFLDLILNFFFSFRDDDDKIVKSNLKIALEYIHGFFLIDVFCAFPLGLFSVFAVEDIRNDFFRQLSYVAWFRMFRILKLTKLKKKKANLNEVSMKNKLIKVGQILFLVTATIHIFACFYVFLAKSTIDELTWVELNGLNGALEVYVASIYFHLVTMFSIGYGDITPTSSKERIYSIIYLFISVMVYSFLISVSANYFFDKDKRTRKYLNKVAKLDQIRNKYDLHWKLYERIKNYLKRHRDTTSDEWYPFIQSLPSSYRREMLLVMHKRYLKELVFFKKRSHDFILSTLPTFKPFKVKKGDVLTDIGEYVDEMYIVTKGKLSLNLGESLYNLRVGEILRYEHFGDCFMFVNERFTYKLSSYVKTSDVLVIKKKDFIKLKSNFYEELKRTVEKSKLFIEKLVERERLINILNGIKPEAEFIKRSLTKIDYHIVRKGFDAMFYGEDSLGADIRVNILAKDLECLLDGFVEEVSKEENLKEPSKVFTKKKSLLPSGKLALHSVNKVMRTNTIKSENNLISQLKEEKEMIMSKQNALNLNTNQFEIQGFDVEIEPSEPKIDKRRSKIVKECQFSVIPEKINSFSLLSNNRELQRTCTPIQNNFYQSIVFKGDFRGAEVKPPKKRKGSEKGILKKKKKHAMPSLLTKFEEKYIPENNSPKNQTKKRVSATKDWMVRFDMNHENKRGSQIITEHLRRFTKINQNVKKKARSSLQIPQEEPISQIILRENKFEEKSVDSEGIHRLDNIFKLLKKNK